ncbi:hypothetical protein JMJ77_0002705, partial [Colletotrichum scovillei]
MISSMDPSQILEISPLPLPLHPAHLSSERGKKQSKHAVKTQPHWSLLCACARFDVGAQSVHHPF